MLIRKGNQRHNTQRPDYADPTQYQGGTGYDSLIDPRRERSRRRLVAFLDRVRPASVVEIGPGSGYLTKTIVEHPAVCRYVAVDVNEAFLSYLDQRLASVSKPGFTYSLVTGTVDDLPADCVDAAVMLSVVHHIPGRENLFRELALRLKRPGHVLAIDPTHYFLRWYKLIRKISRGGYLSHHLAEAQLGKLSTHAMCQLSKYRAVTQSAGFDIVRVEFDDHPRKVRRLAGAGVPLGPLWRWTSQEMAIECVQH
ncbi:MAG: class I SAM-dependent methyltransferase [Acidobacteria bacterium]|nr:class I SAM-dependent methyltransferase [Acidobacteriota bacterium]